MTRHRRERGPDHPLCGEPTRLGMSDLGLMWRDCRRKNRLTVHAGLFADDVDGGLPTQLILLVPPSRVVSGTVGCAQLTAPVPWAGKTFGGGGGGLASIRNTCWVNGQLPSEPKRDRRREPRRGWRRVLMTEGSDEDLLAAIGSAPVALPAFYLRHIAKVLGMGVGRFDQPEDIADFVANVFMEVLRSAGGFDPGRAMRETRAPGDVRRLPGSRDVGWPQCTAHAADEDVSVAPRDLMRREVSIPTRSRRVLVP
jgi:hypothetical protein